MSPSMPGWLVSQAGGTGALLILLLLYVDAPMEIVNVVREGAFRE